MRAAKALIGLWARPLLLSWGWRRWLLSFAMGGFSALAMPPYGWFPILWFTLPSFVWLLDSAKAEAAPTARARFIAFFAVSWWFSFGFFLAGLWWIGEAFLVEADKYAWMIPFVVCVMPAGLSLFPAVLLGLAANLWRPTPSRIIILALCFGVADWLRSFVLTGFPWNMWGYAFGSNLELMQTASIWGVYGLSLLVPLIFAAPAAFVGERARLGGALFVASIAIFSVLFVFGVFRLGAPSAAENGVMLGVIQPNIPQREKWQPENRNLLLPEYIRQTNELRTTLNNPEKTIFFWPESAFPFLLTEEPGALPQISEGMLSNDTLVTGGIRREYYKGNASFYNSVYVVNNQGAVVDIYDKVHLVPFGEYLPARSLLQSLGVERLVPAPADFSAGFKHRKIQLAEDFSVQPLICYEAIFPSTKLNADERPDLLVNLTNDAWFGSTSGPYQHFAQARMRAVEQGIPLVRSANTGISGVIDAYGRILAKVALNKSGGIGVLMPEKLQATLFTRFGNFIFVGFILLLVSLLLVIEGLLPTRRD